MSTPYRELSPLVCHHTKTCCGGCHAAVGGCLEGVRFESKLYNISAGATMDRPNGTPKLLWCTTHLKWEVAVATLERCQEYP